MKRVFLMGAALLVMPSSPAAAGQTNELKFTEFSGYAGGKNCGASKKKKSIEGKDESASGKDVKPSQYTWEGGGEVMAAVAPELFRKLKNCTAKVGGKTIKVMDTCPACSKNGKIDLSHKECSQMGNNPAMPAKLDWENCPGLNPAGRNPAEKTRN